MRGRERLWAAAKSQGGVWSRLGHLGRFGVSRNSAPSVPDLCLTRARTRPQQLPIFSSEHPSPSRLDTYVLYFFLSALAATIPPVNQELSRRKGKKKTRPVSSSLLPWLLSSPLLPAPRFPSPLNDPSCEHVLLQPATPSIPLRPVSSSVVDALALSAPSAERAAAVLLVLSSFRRRALHPSAAATPLA